MQPLRTGKPWATKPLRLSSTSNVGIRVESLRAGLKGGDVKRLTNFSPEYRLRVGDYRALFEVEGSAIVVYRIIHRREAYR